MANLDTANDFYFNEKVGGHRGWAWHCNRVVVQLMLRPIQERQAPPFDTFWVGPPSYAARLCVGSHARVTRTRVPAPLRSTRQNSSSILTLNHPRTTRVQLGRWVERGRETEAEAEMAPPPPPPSNASSLQPTPQSSSADLRGLEPTGGLGSK